MDTGMYGTVAKMHVKPGSEATLRQISETDSPKTPGLVADYLYKADNEPDTYYLAVIFTSKDAYIANAKSPQQHEMYMKYRNCLTADPEWHDGTIVSSFKMN